MLNLALNFYKRFPCHFNAVKLKQTYKFCLSDSFGKPDFPDIPAYMDFILLNFLNPHRRTSYQEPKSVPYVLIVEVSDVITGLILVLNLGVG
jgi:hypothetical protein